MTKAELDAPPMLLTTGDTGRLQEVKQLDLNQPSKTLGIQKTVSGDQTAHATEMKRKSDAYAQGKESSLYPSTTLKHGPGGLPSGSVK